MTLTHFPDGTVMCDCPVPLAMWWHYPDARGWTRVFDLPDDPDAAEAAGEADALKYNASSADDWFIGCPQCRRQYVP